MKRPKNVDDLAATLTNAAVQPLQAAVAAKKPKAAVKQVLLRLPQDIYDQFDSVAVERTKESGRGVSIQQVIMEKLGVG